MPEKELTSPFVLQGIPILFASLLSAIGGMVSYLTKVVQQGYQFNIISFSIEIFISGFVGIVAFLLCDMANFGWSATAAIVAISGHMGVRSLFLLEELGINLLYRRFGNANCKTTTSQE